ncbi:hypothetical protein ccbrp13_35290 [Ktedonobacteria bacterium brp13]|nr:hypothetical protein ccbrp13_35290 [Ktedonobacteria bacterium brp13]
MKSKKQLGMYTITIEDDDSLQIQSPTLLRPLSLDSKQVDTLHTWLNEVRPLASVPIEHSTLATATPVTTAGLQDPDQQPAAPIVSPESVAQQAIHDAIAEAKAEYPVVLEAENRDRFIQQLNRNPQIKPLLTQGKVSYKQIMLWVEQDLSGREA